MAQSSFASLGSGTTGTSPASSFASFGNSTNSFGSFGATDQNSVDALLATAEAKGGAVSQAAQELVHPTTSILSTIGNGFKNAFKDFVNVLSIPSEVVAGALSANYTIGDAINLNIKPSDVIFGAKNPNQTTMQKVGSFVVRTAADVLLDPLTYVTFGTGSGSLFGARAASELTLADGATGVLTKEGTAQLNYLKQVARQSTGLQSALSAGGEEAAAMLPNRLKIFQNIKAVEGSGEIAAPVMSMGKDEVKKLISQTVSSPLNPDFAKVALSRTLAAYPALTETLLDKGGIKFFGKSILSGQRISSVTSLIPGMTWLDTHTEQTRLALGSLFDPSVKGFKQANGATQFVRIPPEFMEYQRKTADMVDYLKESRIQNMDAIMKANKIDPNTSGQFFMAAVENAVMPSDPTLARAYKQLLGYNAKELQYLRGAGINLTKLDNHAPHVLVDSGIKVLPFKMPPSTKVGAGIQRTMEGPIFDATAEQIHSLEPAVLAGNKKLIEDTLNQTKRTGFEIFDDNFFTASVLRSMDNVRSGTMKQFVDGLAGNFAKLQGEAPDGWVGLDLSKYKNANDLLVKQGMADSQMLFHPAIASKIQEFTGSVYGDEGTHAFLTGYDRLQSAWKASVTSIFPSFHGRNAISNVLLNYNDIGLESLNPMTNALAAQLIHTDMQLNGLAKDALKDGEVGEAAREEINNLMTKTAFTDTSGYKWTIGELRSVVKKNNIALRDDIVGQVDTARSTEDMINAIMPSSFFKNPLEKINPFDKNFKPFVWGRKVGNAIEGQARLTNFLTNLRKTGDVQLATARTKQFLFDYNYLTPFEKNVMRRLIPFYSFTRKNLESQVKTLLTAPGRTAAQLTALTNLGDAISGQKLTPQEEAVLPDWIKSGVNILSSKNGQEVNVLSSLGTPVEQPFQAFQPNQLLSSVSPLITLPVELASGYDFFQQKPISDITNAAALQHAPGIIKDFVGYTDVSFVDKNGKKVNMQVALRPDRLHLILNLPITSRVFSAMKQMNAADVSTQSKALQQLIGIRPYAFNLDLEQQKRTQEMQQKLETLLDNAGVGYTLNRFIIQKQ